MRSDEPNLVRAFCMLFIGFWLGVLALGNCTVVPMRADFCRERYAHATTGADSLRIAQDTTRRTRCPLGGYTP